MPKREQKVILFAHAFLLQVLVNRFYLRFAP